MGRRGSGGLLDRENRFAWRWFDRGGCLGGGWFAVLQQTPDTAGLVITDRAAVAFCCDREFLGSIQHILVFKAQVLGELVDSDFAAAGHSGGVSGRAGHEVPRWPLAKRGQCLVCLSGSSSLATESLLQRREKCIGHLTSQGFLQSFPAPRLF